MKNNCKILHFDIELKTHASVILLRFLNTCITVSSSYIVVDLRAKLSQLEEDLAHSEALDDQKQQVSGQLVTGTILQHL